MTAKIKASSDGLKVTIGNAAEDALEINQTTKTIKALAPYLLNGDIAAQSLASNGYVKLASGLIIQWGGINTNTNGDATVTLQITFPTGIGAVLAVPALANRNNVFNAYSHSKTFSNFQIYSFQTINGAAQAMAVDWIAIGF